MLTDTNFGDFNLDITDFDLYLTNGTDCYTILGSGHAPTVTYDTVGIHDRTMPVDDWRVIRDMYTRLARLGPALIIDGGKKTHETEGFAESQALSDFLDSFPIKK